MASEIEEQFFLNSWLGFLNASIVVNPIPDPDWIRIQVGEWIRIGIQILIQMKED